MAKVIFTSTSRISKTLIRKFNLTPIFIDGTCNIAYRLFDDIVPAMDFCYNIISLRSVKNHIIILCEDDNHSYRYSL